MDAHDSRPSSGPRDLRGFRSGYQQSGYLRHVAATQGNSRPIDSLGKKYSVHFGTEKIFLFDKQMMGMRLLSIRAGGFTDPDHDSYANLKTGDTHYTFDLGTVVAEHLQLDLGAEWSNRVNAAVMSCVYHF